MNARDGARAGGGYRKWVYLVFVLATGCSLAVPAFRNGHFFGVSMKEADYVCQLDSFAEPAVAEAVIQNEAERLLRAFIQTRDLEAQADSNTQLRNNPGRPRSPRQGCGEAICVPEPHWLSATQLANVKQLECLSTRVQRLKSDVDRKLLAIYSEVGLWNEFTECYLEFLREAPGDSRLVEWALFALVRAQQVGRASDVAEALQQAIRANRNLKTARGLQDALETWGAKGTRDAQAPNP